MKTTTAFLVDRAGIVHGKQVFYFAKDVTQAQVNHMNPCVMATTGLKYTLAEPGTEDFLTHIEKLFETEAR